MKNKKKVFIIAGSALAVFFAVILLITLVLKNNYAPAPSETMPMSEMSDIVIDDPSNDTVQSDMSEDGKVTVEVDDPGLTPVDETQSGESESADRTDKKADMTAKPISEAKPETNKPDGGEIVIGDNVLEQYNCGAQGHHCDGPETHAYVLNLELDGCPYCGSNECASFYATDEWRQTCYTPSKCPEYDIHKDSVYYCQTCGKKCGDGRGSTCVQFVESCECPNCGKHVDSWTCHSCK